MTYLMTREEALAEIRARVEAATEGPWENDETDPGVWGPEHIIIGNYTARDDFDSPMWEDGTPEDREFIAASRTDLPTLLAAVEAVMKLHAPIPIYVLAEECEAPEDHEHGTTSDGGEDICWDEPTGETYCNECNDVWGDPVDYPCPTVQAITTALEVKE